MSRVNFNLAAVLALSILLAGCGASTGNTKLAKMDHHQVSNMIVKGKTHANEIRAQLGDPTDINIDDNGNRKWVYAHTKSDLKATAYIPYVNLVSSGTNDTTKKLIICFDKQDRVVDYMITQSKGETKTGLVH